MSVTTTILEPKAVRARGGCGTLESPWTGWEDQVESSPGSRDAKRLSFPAGFWQVSRPIRLGSETVLQAADDADGRAWFLPPSQGEALECLFRIDGAQEVQIEGLHLNGRGKQARHGLLIVCGLNLEVNGCHFGDFQHERGSALTIAGDSEDRPVRSVVLQSCRFVHGHVGVRLEHDLSDLLITANRFEEFVGPAIDIDPGDRWSEYGLIAVRNRFVRASCANAGPFLSVHAGAEGIRLADNTFEGPEGKMDGRCAAIEVCGGGPMSRRRVELVHNTMSWIPGPAIAARQCGPGFLTAGNYAADCGDDDRAVLDIEASQGVVVEDNRIVNPASAGLTLRDCSSSRVNGNDIEAAGDSVAPRSGTNGLVVTGPGSRSLRITDNRVLGVRGTGVAVDAGRRVRVMGNEVQDCRFGIEVREAQQLVVVGNDCRDNSEGGIRIDESVEHAFVSLNHAILNGPVDLAVHAARARCHGNKVDHAEP